MNKKELNQKISYYFEHQLPVHVTKPMGKFANGYITEVSAVFFIIRDDRFGVMPIFHSEIVDIEPYRERTA